VPASRWKLNRYYFCDVAGIDGSQRTQEVVTFLKQPERFTAIRPRFLRCVLVGSPGTGKTLLAKAIAGEAGYHFSASPARNLSKCLSLEASRVRDLFKKAKKMLLHLISLMKLMPWVTAVCRRNEEKLSTSY